MTRQLFYGKGLVAIALLSLLATPALAGEIVTFPGNDLQDTEIVIDRGNFKLKGYLAPTGTDSGKSDSITNNTVTLDSGTAANVLGGLNTLDSEAVSGNTVILNGGTVTGGDPVSTVIGGRAFSATANARTASNNQVIINGGDVNGMAVGGWASGPGDMTASGNSVTINGGTVTAPDNVLVGGWGYSSQGIGTASGNRVSITGGTVNVKEIFGGWGFSEDTGATASGNSVAITGGDVTVTNVIGGYSSDNITGAGGGAHTGTGTGATVASGNSVLVQSGTVNNLVVGGVAGSAGGPAVATGNTITIHQVAGKNLDLSQATIAGSYRLNTPTATGSDFFTGNTLNVQSDTGETITVKNARNIENYNFIVSSNQGSTPVLTVTDNLYLDDSYETGYANGRSSTITASTVGGAPLAVGSNVKLFDATNIEADDFDATQVIQGRHGAVLNYRSTLDATTGVLTMDSVEVNPQAKALSEGFLGGLALTTQGADLVAGQGMGNAVSAGTGNGFGAFAAIAGGKSRYDTGSHVDMSSISLMTGLAWGVDTTPGHLTLGAFFEFGTGSYDTNNSFSNAASVNGDGDTYYTGGGILGRMDFANTGPGRFYTEASARMGKVNNEYESSDLRDPLGRSADYDSSSLYYGLHLGTGYIWNITEKASLDLYGKYFWTRQEGDSVTLSTDDPVRFKDADSHRLRGGARFAYAVNEYVSPYIGAAYEHEFDGKARASTYGYSIDAPELTGGTGIGEIGLTLKPSATLPLSFDLGIQGYTGQREGVTGSLQAKFEF